MKAIQINSTKRTITAIEVSGLESMQAVVGGDIEVATEIKHNDKWNTFYCNEEGLSLNVRDWFIVQDAHQPFKGNGLIVGFDPDSGESIDTNLTVEDVKKVVKFADDNTISLYMTMGMWK